MCIGAHRMYPRSGHFLIKNTAKGKLLIKSISFKTCSKSVMCFLSSNIFSWKIAWLLNGWLSKSGLGLRSILVDGPPVMTIWVVQMANVAGEEARQFLNEIDLRRPPHLAKFN